MTRSILAVSSIAPSVILHSHASSVKWRFESRNQITLCVNVPEITSFVQKQTTSKGQQPQASTTPDYSIHPPTPYSQLLSYSTPTHHHTIVTSAYIDIHPTHIPSNQITTSQTLSPHHPVLTCLSCFDCQSYLS
jgi:hypothetical protein